MARVTVEECLDFVENRFKLVLLASKRARQLAMGTEPLVEWENDKPTVVALREIEHGLVNEEMMKAALAEPIEEEMEYNEDDLAAALHAEISRELNQTASDATATPVEAGNTPEGQPAPSLQNTFFASAISANTSDNFQTSEPQESSITDTQSADQEAAPPLFGEFFGKENSTLANEEPSSKQDTPISEEEDASPFKSIEEPKLSDEGDSQSEGQAPVFSDEGDTPFKSIEEPKLSDEGDSQSEGQEHLSSDEDDTSPEGEQGF